MTSRRILRARHLMAMTVVAASGLLAGCSDEPVATPVIHDISEPWQEAPFAVPEDVLARIEAACRQGDLVPATVPIAVMDVRGAGVGVVILADPRNQGECLVVPGDAPGTFAMSVAGAAKGIGLNLPVGPLAISNETIGTAQLGPLDGRSITFVHGQVGADVGVVEIVLPSGQRVQASNWSRGWFAAWWPGEEQAFRWNIYDRNGILVSPS